jgi:tetratricopeptide (TPR) repeat protein
MRYPIKFFIILVVWVAPLKVACQGNLLANPIAFDHVKEGLFYIYNTESEQAEKYIRQTEKLMPQHPVGPMMRALNINWSANPIEADTEEFRKLIGHLQLSLDRTKNYLKNDPENMEAVFFAMAIYSWLAQFYDEDGQTFKALNAAKNAYQYMKVGFDMLDQSPEFYFSTGLYNYYRVQYPESNPVYKPFLWFFREGNKELGLSQLDHASSEAIFTRAEASMYLAHIYLRYEDKPSQAVTYSSELVQRFPGNIFFKINYTEALLAAAEYNKAYPIIQKLLKEEKLFYRMSGEIFYAIYYEKHLKDTEVAKIWYRKSLESGKNLGARANNKKSLAYAGLARIAAANRQVDQARDYYRTAMKLAQYDEVKNEAKHYLRNN